MIPDSATTVFERTLHDFLESNAPLDITETAKPQRYRLLDCAAFCKRGAEVIRIFEFQLPDNHELSSVGYAAISYVWRDSNIQGEGDPQFSVKGAESADPISIDVLRQTCYASIHRGCGYLWLDRLCIMQTNREDKRWQIQHMNQVYRSCKLCIVLPGGLQRCVRLDEPTLWVFRAWTLQEALAPSEVTVLLAWKLGSGLGCAGDVDPEEIEEIDEGRSAIFPLTIVLDSCYLGWMAFTRSGDSVVLLVQARVLSSRDDTSHGVFAPNVSALILARTFTESDDIEARNYAIWQSALVRTSSRPVDMVFSIMGLFDVVLDPNDFEEDDRLKATIALAKGILDKGGCASWIGASFWLEQCSCLSTFSIFPKTRVEGKATVPTTNGAERDVSDSITNEYPMDKVISLPRGRMDDDGYFTFCAKAILIVRTQNSTATGEHDSMLQPTQFCALDGSSWTVATGQKVVSNFNVSPPRNFVVLLSRFNVFFPGATPASDNRGIRAMLVGEHAPDRFDVQSYFFFSNRLHAWVKSWEEYKFCIGGPNAFGGHMQDLHDENLTTRQAQHIRDLVELPESLHSSADLAHRWSIPQTTLELYHQAGDNKYLQLVTVLDREGLRDSMVIQNTGYALSGHDLEAILQTGGAEHLFWKINDLGHIQQNHRKESTGDGVSIERNGKMYMQRYNYPRLDMSMSESPTGFSSITHYAKKKYYQHRVKDGNIIKYSLTSAQFILSDKQL